MFVSVIKNCMRKELQPIIDGNVLSKSDAYIDGWLAYDGLVTAGFRHHRVYHEANEFVRGKNHINGIESFWSFAKFRFANFAKLHGVRWIASSSISKSASGVLIIANKIAIAYH